MALVYTDELLDRLRTIGDPEPDRIIEELARAGEIDEVNQVLRHLVHNAQPIPEELPDNIEFWLRETAALPSWAERKRLERAAELFLEHGIRISVILCTSALIECYAARKGVKVLAHSYRLGQNPYRRIGETSQWVLLVMAPGGLFEQGQGIPAIQKIRLMHAAIRHLIRQTGRWDEAEYGVPICQEDLLGTLITFSYLVIRDLRKMGVDITDQEADDYLYLWRVVGEMLGVQPEFIPESMEQAEMLSSMITRRHHGPSPEGVHMTSALLEMCADLTPGDTLDGIMPALSRALVGDQIADWMEIPRTKWEWVFNDDHVVGKLLNVFERNSFVIDELVDRIGMALLSREAIAMAGYERAAFEIPTELREAWVTRGKLQGTGTAG